MQPSRIARNSEDTLVGGEPKPDDSWITFLSRRSGANILYKMRPNGDELTPVFGGEISNVPGFSPGQTLYREPHWSRLSPDRSFYLSWTIDRILTPENSPGSASYMIHLGCVHGGPTRVLSPNYQTGEVFCWAPDSQRIAYSRFTGSDGRSSRGPGPPSTQVVVATVDGSHEEVVLEKPGFWIACDWSPDGRNLLLLYWPTNSTVYGRSDLIEFDLFTAMEQKARFAELRPGDHFASGSSIEFSCLRSLTDGQPVSSFHNSARYSPSGTKIAVTFSRRMRAIDLEHYELGIWDVASATLESAVHYSNGLRGPICWSPDETQILFSRPPAPACPRDPQGSLVERDLEIWAIRSDATEARFLTSGWSPDWR
jgi:hypothetical protein